MPRAAAAKWPYPHRTVAEIDAAASQPSYCRVCDQSRRKPCTFKRCGLA
jgi:hypothetical protein